MFWKWKNMESLPKKVYLKTKGCRTCYKYPYLHFEFIFSNKSSSSFKTKYSNSNQFFQKVLVLLSWFKEKKWWKYKLYVCIKLCK